MPQKNHPGNLWPVLTRYDHNHLGRIALPLGGIGTGTVSLGGRGDLRDWEIVNRPAKGFAPKNAFCALWAKAAGQAPVTRALEGPLEPWQYEGAFGSPVPNHSLPRFKNCAFEAAYPFGQVLLSDPGVPVSVRLQAFNPLVPADAKASGFPLAVFRFVLTNKTAKPVSAAVSFSLENFIGSDGTNGQPLQNVNEFRTGAALSGIFMRSAGVKPDAEQFGTLALATTAKTGLSHRTAWAKLSWGNALLDFWDDFGSDGALEERDGGGVAAPVASLAARLTLAPRAEKSVTFLLAWHFPNRQTWTPQKKTENCACSTGVSPAAAVPPACGAGVPPAPACNPDYIGNYYATLYADAWDAAEKAAAELPRLEAETLRFVRSFCDSDLSPVVKEAALYNLSTLRSQTCFRTADGRFFAWEGCGDKSGCCHGSCTHVWNYEHATGFLFGELALAMREVEFLHATRDDGHMSFRVNLPLARAAEGALAAADGQMGCLLKLYRDWQLSGDEALLARLWPRARKALEFCWIKGGWDGDQDGVMEGCQHNTMDVEYYGPNPQMCAWYLGALRAGEEMARHLGDNDFAARCRTLFQQGSAWVDRHLFNGEYYEHHIQPVADGAAIAPGLRHEQMGARNLSDPELQLGSGCLVDQLVGQYTAHVCGLGYLLDEKHVRTTLRSIMKHNFKKELYAHFNHLRSFALCEESALLMAAYPKGRRPRQPFPYYNEVMTGFEYTAAVHMLYEGHVADGLKVIEAIRARYDGRKRSPFDEAECGHHYGRAMASWAALLALTGFEYSGVTQTLRFKAAPKRRRWFWSTGHAWGVFEQAPAKGGMRVMLQVLHGALKLKTLALQGFGAATLPAARTLTAGQTVEEVVTRGA
ncbi:MAG: GH116 family glycosyl-hydrolase [Planctomycetota bacterium]